MLKKIFLLGFFVAVLHNTMAADIIPGKVVFYREYSYQGAALSYKVFAGGVMLVKLRNSSYYEHYFEPGEYIFQVEKDKKARIGLHIEEGKTYYVRFGIRAGMWSTITELLLVDSISGYAAVQKESMRQLAQDHVPMIRPKSRFGLNLNMGAGFESTPMVQTTDGKESSISSGGGYAVGLKYGYEFSRIFDLAVDLLYQSSELTPRISNGSISFSRGILSVTPSFIIPVDGGDAMRFKTGAGVDYYFGNTMSFDTGKIQGGFKDKWNYSNTLGFHASVIFEMNMSEKWSFNYGLKWYNVNYEFNSGGIYFPVDNNLGKPGGSGIDFLMGFIYHF
jgi:hypothetical protein